MSKHLARLALAAALALGATAARAGTDSATMNVSANVVSACTITAAPLNFGDYDPIGANATTDLEASADFTLTCTKSAKVDLTLTKTPLTNGASTLTYALYSDSGHNDLLDDTGATVVKVTGAGKDGQLFTIYGVIPAAQDPDEGVHSGTVVANITF